MSWEKFKQLDTSLLALAGRLSGPISRLALCLVYVWFGGLKVVAESPANPLVKDLLAHTLPFISFEHFIVFLGCFEVIIGLTFLVPGLERLAAFLLIPHMITTFMPLVLLPSVTWQVPFVPTLEGQYIIKNVLIIALAITLLARRQVIPQHSEHALNN